MSTTFLPQIWHICPTEPTTRIPAPPSPELFIGAIVRSKVFEHLRAPLNRSERPTMPSGWLKEAGPMTTSHRIRERKTGSVGFFTTITRLIGLGPHGSVDWTRDTDVVYNFEEERDIWLEVPADERRTDTDDSASVSMSLCEDAVTASATVQKFLNDCDWRKPVYMVTGIKWVSGISIGVGSSSEIGGQVGLEADLTAVCGVPATIGLQSSGLKGSIRAHSTKGGSPFVFCVKLTKLKWDRQGVLRTEDVRKGAYMNVDEPQVDREQELACVMVVRDASAQDFDDSEAIKLIDQKTGLENEFIYDMASPMDF